MEPTALTIKPLCAGLCHGAFQRLLWSWRKGTGEGTKLLAQGTALALTATDPDIPKIHYWMQIVIVDIGRG